MLKQNLTRRRLLQTAMAAPFAACAPAIDRKSGDGFILRGGPIWRDARTDNGAVTLVVRGGKVQYAGPEGGIGSGTSNLRVIDLGGATAFPGFVDAHCHVTGIGLRELTLDLTGTPSLAALVDKLRAYAAAHKDGAIIGRGWIETHWPEKRFPSRADIDTAVADRPVYLERADGHAAVVNSAALTLAGITDSTPDPQGGRIERDAKGAATGMLIDNATALVEGKLPAPSAALKREAVERAVALYASRGWTGVGSMSSSVEQVEALGAMAAAGKPMIRSDHYLDPGAMGDVLARGPYADKSGLVRVRGIKLYMDGALGSRGAALLAPYADMPSTSGLLVTPAETIADLCAKARAAGAQVAMHAIGDRGNRLALDAFEAAFKSAAADTLGAARWRIEHAQVIPPADIPRFGKLGVVASMQPSHAIGDLYFAPSRLGPERLKGAYAWKSLLDSGATIAAGSDAPVEKGDPRIEFYAATYRHSLDGFAGADWHLEEAVSRAQALHMLTVGTAHAAFAENERGTLQPGKRADISVFSKDLLSCEPSEIPKAEALLAVVDGKVVHSNL
ncbi:MAG: amidohydrolase [Alphaproteobacteria bacterium]